jgi:opacity protein-like surface antigen
MKKMMLSGVMALAMAGTATSAMASDIDYYAGIGLGTLNTEYKDNAVDQTKMSAGGFLKLGADFNENFGAELRLGRTGKNNQVLGGVSRSFQSPLFVSYLAKGRMQVADNLDLYLLAGATTARIKATRNNVSQTVTKTGLSLGAGADYRLSRTISVGGDWVQYMFPTKVSGAAFGPNAKARMWGITANVAYHF